VSAIGGGAARLAVATSGDYRRYFITRTGALAHARSAHRLPDRQRRRLGDRAGPTCMAADALSTALTVMGVEAGLAFAEERGWRRATWCARAACANAQRRLARAAAMMITTEPCAGAARCAVASYLAMCAATCAPRAPCAARRPRRPADWLVVYASQTGSAEYLARRSATLLATGGLAARAACISSLDAASLRGRAASCSSPAPTAKATRPTPPRASPAA
jgi:hypothetical protein